MPIDEKFPKSHHVIGNINMQMENITILSGDQVGLMPKHQQNQKFRLLTKREAKNMLL
jgi:translation initiation factor IF-1